MAASPVKLLKNEKQPLLPPWPPGPEESIQQPPAAPGPQAPQDPTAPAENFTGTPAGSKPAQSPADGGQPH